MNKTVRKIILILVVLILLPAAFLTINEIISLDQNEEVLGRIYSNQLDAILYSVNQYSEDVVSSWASKIDRFLDEESVLNAEDYSAVVDSFYDQMPSLYAVFVADSTNDESIELPGWNSVNNKLLVDSIQFNSQIKKLLIKNQGIIKRLFTYKSSSYRKLEPVETDSSDEGSVILFINQSSDGINRIIGMLIDPKEFTYRILSPKLQDVAQQEFLISVFNPSENYQFNSTKDFRAYKIQQSKPLWIFPDYSIGISLAGKTIEDLVQQRALTNILLIGLLQIFC